MPEVDFSEVKSFFNGISVENKLVKAVEYEPNVGDVEVTLFSENCL